MKYILFNEKLENNINGIVINDIDEECIYNKYTYIIKWKFNWN